MNRDTQRRQGRSRRSVLRTLGVGTVVFGTGVAALSGRALAMNKAELIEAMASEAGLSKADAKRTVDAITGATTKALKKGDRIAVVGFGSFRTSKRAARAEAAGKQTTVRFEPCPAFAAALDLSPGKGDDRRNQSCPAERTADLVVDAALIASETRRGSDRGLSEATAGKALDAFVDATAAALRGDDDVTLAGFGSFSISKRSARTGRNPQREKESSAKNEVKFKAGAELSKAVN
ncbi:HU family DNA-binding protein [Haloplanus rubicundus]|nr:HU family DNA-binding protein [Haloplanus rubicundus]